MYLDTYIASFGNVTKPKQFDNNAMLVMFTANLKGYLLIYEIYCFYYWANMGLK